MIDYAKVSPAYRQQNKLKDVAQHVHETLTKQTKQNRKERSTEELFQDFLNVGTVEPHPTHPDKAYLVTDHHGDKFLLPKRFLGESFNWPLDKILADPHPSEGRQFKSDDCVRLMTNKYLHRGMPKGIEEYVSGVVSNKFLRREANYCQVMFVLACQDETTVWEGFLEVEEHELQLCDKKHSPFKWQGMVR